MNNVVSFADATAEFTGEGELDIILYVPSRDAGIRGTSFKEAIIEKKYKIVYEQHVNTATSTRREFHLKISSLNFAVTTDLLPFINKYLAAVEKRRREEDDETSSPVGAPARKAACPAAPADERYALAIKSFAASSEGDLESLQKLLTAEIEKRKKPPVSQFVDTRAHLLPPSAVGGAASSR